MLLGYHDILSTESIERNYRVGVQAQRWEDRIRGGPPDRRVVVALRSGVLLGAVHSGPTTESSSSAPDLAEVHHVFVRGPERGGVGRAMLDRTRQTFAAAGKRRAVLWVFEANSAARSFYERTGWWFTGLARVDPALVGEGMQVRECLYESDCPGTGPSVPDGRDV